MHRNRLAPTRTFLTIQDEKVKRYNTEPTLGFRGASKSGDACASGIYTDGVHGAL
jgi:hypothetical protein